MSLRSLASIPVISVGNVPLFVNDFSTSHEPQTRPVVTHDDVVILFFSSCSDVIGEVLLFQLFIYLIRSNSQNCNKDDNQIIYGTHR